MKLEDILELSRAGWTKEDIIRLSGTEEQPSFQAEPVETLAPAPAVEAPTPEPKAEAKGPDPSEEKLNDIIAKLEKVSSGMQQMAVQNSRLPERETVDDILASFINPKS